MKVFELDSDARLTREMIREFGDEYTIRERLKLKSYGIGNLRLVNAHPALLEFYDSRDHTIKTHFDWTKNGAVIRIRTMKKNYALGLKDDEILNIDMTKEADLLYLLPFSPGRLLLHLGLSHKIVRWLPFGGRRFMLGPVVVRLTLKDAPPLVFELKGDLWKDSLSTFVNLKTKERTKTFDNGYRIF